MKGNSEEVQKKRMVKKEKEWSVSHSAFRVKGKEKCVGERKWGSQCLLGPNEIRRRGRKEKIEKLKKKEEDEEEEEEGRRERRRIKKEKKKEEEEEKKKRKKKKRRKEKKRKEKKKEKERVC